MITIPQTLYYDLYDDTLEITYNGSQWMTSNQSQHATPSQAMRAEIEACYEADGDDVDEYYCRKEIETHVASFLESSCFFSGE